MLALWCLVSVFIRVDYIVNREIAVDIVDEFCKTLDV